MSKHDAGLEPLLAHLRDARGFDFTGYKPAGLERRIRKRMETLGLSSYEDYQDHLEVHPGEFHELFNTILINVTSFFRDPDAWAVLASDVIPVIAERTGDGPIRVWSAGCASGQEAYTAAISFVEALGAEEFRRRVKIYATDVDEAALEQARLGLYDAAHLDAVPEELRERYFERSGSRWCFRKDLRRAIVFGRNNLVEDAPISRVDLLLCRNTLMYFTQEAQGHIVRRFHFALKPTGFLFLGKSEMLLSRRELFQPVDVKRRIFTKVERPADRRPAPPVLPSTGGAGPARYGNIAERALDAAATAQIVVGRDRALLLANEAARRSLRLGSPDIGRLVQDLEVSYRPVELRAALDAAFADGRTVVLGPVTHRHDVEDREYEVRIAPLPGDVDVDAVSVSFLDVTARHRAEQEVERARVELGAAYEELQATVEELETTNEELQSTNEELETTNEELQSTNEELETMNEELQSANEELATINDELRTRSNELRGANAVMEAILRVKRVGVVVIDHDQRVRSWNTESEDLWGLRADEVHGTPVAELDIGLPVSELLPAVRRVFSDGSHPVALELPATDRRGRPFVCSLSVVPLSMDADGVAAAIVLAERARDGRAG